jgi:hypothetical protein
MGPWLVGDAGDNMCHLLRPSSIVGTEVVTWDTVVARSPGAGEHLDMGSMRGTTIMASLGGA